MINRYRNFASQCVLAMMAMIGMGMTGSARAQTDLTLTFIGQTSFETGFIYEDTEVGGLSGLEYIPLLDRFIALSDDHGMGSEERMYELTIDLADGMLNGGDIVFTNVTTLLNRDGQPFADSSVDPEAIRFDPTSLTLYWGNEGNANDGFPPTIHEMTLSGRFVRELTPPASFLTTADLTQGVRHNLSFESLSLSGDGKTLFTATENALFQDGPIASINDSSPCRLLEFDSTTGAAQRQFIYMTDPIPPPAIPGGFNLNGLVAMLAVSDTQFIVVERALSLPNFVIKLYLADISNATDVAAFNSIQGLAVQPVAKELLIDLTELGIRLDNIEGMSFGPILPSGARSLVLVSDNNFNGLQRTQFLAFSVVEPSPR